MMGRAVYEGSDGHCYTEREIWERLESGEWTVCCWDYSTGQEWVSTPADELLSLRPIESDELKP